MSSDEGTAGHRKRLRDKFLKSGLAGFHDYEIVELLLTLGTPRRDCKEQAKEAVRKFKSLRGVLEAAPEELQEINGIGPYSVFGVKLVQEVAREFLKEKIVAKPVYQSSKEIFDFLYHAMRDLKKEVFKVIYLNSQNQIIEIVDLFKGTVNSGVISPRETIESAIKRNAVAMILVHNHPSGNPEPSSGDKTLTREMVFAGNIVEIRVLDHIIIGNDKYYSFAAEGLIEEYGMDYLNLKLRGTAEAKKRLYKARESGIGVFGNLEQ